MADRSSAALPAKSIDWKQCSPSVSLHFWCGHRQSALITVRYLGSALTRSPMFERCHGMDLHGALVSHESGFKYTLAGICSVQHLTDGSSRPSSITLSLVWNCLSRILALLGKGNTPKFCLLKAERRRGGGGGWRHKSVLLTHPPRPCGTASQVIWL